MSLNWSWNDKIGTWTENLQGKEFTFNVYKCNGLAVILHEYKEKNEDFYQMHGFFVDKEHLKNMLGTGKNSEHENYYNNVLVRLELHSCKETNTIITEIIKAEWDKEIEIKLLPSIPF